MSYNLSNIPKLSELLYNSDKATIAKSLNLKYNSWKHKNGVKYHILKYDKEWLSNELVQSHGLLRSIIYKDDGSIVCFAPPKSYNTEKFELESGKTYTAETFVEGTMINVFYEKESDSWEIATRSSIGGESCFFMEAGFKRENTFKFMFQEACNKTGFQLENLNKKYIYSFVLQHPRNRIVKIITNEKLYLVDVYEVVGTTINIIPIKDNFEELGILEKHVKTAERQTIENEEQLNNCKEMLASMKTRYDVMGVVVKCSDGRRYKFRNPNYETVKKLRGNNPKLQYQYLVLRQNGKVKDYLQYYKEHKNAFSEFRNVIHEYTNELFSNYISCYIKKQKELKEFPEKYKTHMYCLHHDLYLKELMPEKKYVTKDVVINYFNTLHPSKQMFVLNYDVRKNYLEGEKHAMKKSAKLHNSESTTEDVTS